jgi:hypothetical protein
MLNRVRAEAAPAGAVPAAPDAVPSIRCDARGVSAADRVGSDSKAAALLQALESDVADTIGQGLATGRGQGSAD